MASSEELNMIAGFDEKQMLKLIISNPEYLVDKYYQSYYNAIHKRVEQFELEKVHLI